MSGKTVVIPLGTKYDKKEMKKKGFKFNGGRATLPTKAWSCDIKNTRYENAFMGLPADHTVVNIYRPNRKLYLTISSYQDSDYYAGATYTYS